MLAIRVWSTIYDSVQTRAFNARIDDPAQMWHAADDQNRRWSQNRYGSSPVRRLSPFVREDDKAVAAAQIAQTICAYRTSSPSYDSGSATAIGAGVLNVNSLV